MEVRLGMHALNEQMRVARGDPQERRGEPGVEERVPDGEEAAERAVLKIDVIPAIEEETGDERRRQ